MQQHAVTANEFLRVDEKTVPAFFVRRGDPNISSYIGHGVDGARCPAGAA